MEGYHLDRRGHAARVVGRGAQLDGRHLVRGRGRGRGRGRRRVRGRVRGRGWGWS